MTARSITENTQLFLHLQDKIAFVHSQVKRVIENQFSLTEADTERLIIEPLLSTLGYEPYHFLKRNQDKVTGKYPDYTILPGTQYVWFLEAKKLDHVLGDSEAEQAVNYANNQGARWAVLTNGRSWYVYDAPARQPLAKKRVGQIANIFSDSDAVGVLASLSYTSITGGTDDGGEVTELLPLTLNLLNGALPNSQDIEKAMPSTLYTFAELAMSRITPSEEKLVAIISNNGVNIPVQSWTDVFTKSAAYLCEQYGIPNLPFSEAEGQKQCFLNSEPIHPSGDPMWHKPLHINGDIVYMHWKGLSSVPRSMKRVAALIEKIGAPLDALRLQIG